MNNYIIINRTYCEITPESCENSDFSDTGFIEENQQVTFRELVDLMISHTISSRMPKSYNIKEWYSTDFFTEDYSTGTQREESVHFAEGNTPNAAKYWKYARIAADNIIKNRWGI